MSDFLQSQPEAQPTLNPVSGPKLTLDPELLKKIKNNPKAIDAAMKLAQAIE
jgi:hypothetical protein